MIKMLCCVLLSEDHLQNRYLSTWRPITRENFYFCQEKKNLLKWSAALMKKAEWECIYMLGHIQILTLLSLFFPANQCCPLCPHPPHTSSHYFDQAEKEVLFLKCHFNYLGWHWKGTRDEGGTRKVNWYQLWGTLALMSEFGLCGLEVRRV